MARNIDELPSNIQITDIVTGKPTQAFVFYLQSIQKTTEQGATDVVALQKEIDDTQTGAGLNSGGNYITPTTTNYINSATSLYNADLLLDTAIYNQTRALITTTSISATLSEESQIVLVDATTGDINITLPNPTNCFSANRSLKIGIYKKDTSTNLVNILPFDTELVVGESSQTLRLDGEILNFITDGADWYLQN